ncbi:transcriptional regulatory protein YpdB [Clostridium acetireducens DSM 10703]|jgi:two-component system LytT family response regulator|uniref:Stage 0 sporulation protein A homolog n=1 Tax=Clostridium acetireducens DSM 10703 TaxID=1121290 RepID=A0A1E8EXZ2_9CLOT|nr:LytTR family DNA-binding domain-containing protein [Clostridium acetireducens]OFI05552.1 transcriptional regulatory protein YpdB [Clostridium acetireducens DSM 10703]
MNCIIIDDEYPSIQELKYFISNFSDIKIDGEFEDALTALDYLQKNSVDIVFLDISMPKINGMEFGKIINNFDKKPKIVFITAYKEYAIEAFEVHAFDYILKPYSQDRILNTLKNLEKCNNNSCISKKITLWKNEKLVVINTSDILYCEAKERTTIVYIKNDNFIVKESISNFLKKLPQVQFFRTHRSFIVNLDKIVEIIPWFNNTFILRLKGIDSKIPVSRNNVHKFKEIMNI